MKEPLFTGLATAMITPFTREGINFPVFETLIDRQLNAGVRTLVICGTTGESASLSAEERILLISHAVRYAQGRCKIIAGTGTNDTRQSVHLSKMAQDCGADGLLVITPYYNKTSQEGLVAHYRAIGEAVSIPIILYNVPSRTGMRIDPETYKALSQLPNICGVKEASGDLAMVSRIQSLCDLTVWSGDDALTAPMLAMGAQGVISTTSNLMPKPFVALCRAGLMGDFQTCAKIQRELSPVIDAMFCEVNPMPLKAAMQLSGLAVGDCRPPLCHISAQNQARLEKILSK